MEQQATQGEQHSSLSGQATRSADREAWQAERTRLFIRGAELRARSRLLARSRPFLQSEHDELRGALHAYFLDVQEFKARSIAAGRWRADL
jgi:hypothetical protein